MKIGIGVCSYKRPDLATKVCEDILKTTDKNKHEIQTICSVDDHDTTGYEWIAENFGLIHGPNSGIPVNKNRLLHFLKDNDVVFISEDDICFKKSGWIDVYLRAIEQSGFQHMNYIVSDYRKMIKKALKYESIHLGLCGAYVNGVLMVMTKECLNQVGAFDERYNRYGYEHADYTRRCRMAGMYHPKEHFHVMESTPYIDWIHTPSVIDESDKKKYIQHNARIYHGAVPKIHIPISAEYTHVRPK